MKAIRVAQTWLVDPFTQVKSAEHRAKIIEHKSQIKALQSISECIKRQNQVQVHNFPFKNAIFLTVEYKMYLKILKNFAAWSRFKTGQTLR